MRVALKNLAALPLPGGYDTDGDLLTAVDSVMGQWKYSYDNLTRVLGATAPVSQPAGANAYHAGLQTGWSYDAFGNRLHETQGKVSGASPTASMASSSTSTYVGGSNQFNTTTLASAITYDAAGDVTYDGTDSYLYDAQGQLCAVQSQRSQNSSIIQYAYDAEGNRIAKGTITTAPASNTSTCSPPFGSGFAANYRYLVDQSGDQVTELNGSGVWQHSNIWAAGKLVATYDTKGLHFDLTDPLGTKRVQADANGYMDEYCTSLPFGNDINNPVAANCTQVTNALNTGDDATEHHFTGKERDQESGNDYFEPRYYSSAMGRFMSPDWSAKEEPVPYAKLDDPQSLNLYSYVLNNPLILEDNDGHEIRLANATPQDRADYQQSVAYLSRNPVERAIIKSLTDSQTVYTISIAHNDDNADAFHPTTNTVSWDPRSALATADDNGKLNGETQTPALGLGHELDHANGKETGTTANGADPNYGGRGGKEEKRVITGSETNAAGTLNEGTRTNHDGTGYQSAGSTSRVPTHQGTQTLRASEAQRHQKRIWFHVKKNPN